MSDRRTTPSNGRVAHETLRGKIKAERFTEGEAAQVTAPVANLWCDRDARDQLDRQLLFGDPFLVLERVGEFAFGQAERGGYVGYVKNADLGQRQPNTDVVRVRSTFGFTKPDIKTPAPIPLSLGSQVRVVGETGRFKQTHDGFYIPADHLRPLTENQTDPVAVAELLIGTPYLWGGNSAFGIDCSGLVQAGCLASGVPCPGDSDQQEQQLGRLLEGDEPPKRGDLLFWKGHVAWVADGATILHANAFHMNVAYEPLAAAIKRIEAQGGGPVTARKRVIVNKRGEP